MHEINSAAVAAIGYSGRTGELHVRFRKSGVVYIYANVPFFVVGAIFRSNSRGKAMHRHVINKLEYRKEEFA